MPNTYETKGEGLLISALSRWLNDCSREAEVRKWFLILVIAALAMATTVKVAWTYNGKPVNFIIDD